MDQQERTTETAAGAARQARIDTAREGLRSALTRLAKAGHDKASAKDGDGRATEAGQVAPSGQ